MKRAQLELLRDWLRAEIAHGNAYDDGFVSNESERKAQADEMFERVAAEFCGDE